MKNEFEKVLNHNSHMKTKVRIITVFVIYLILENGIRSSVEKHQKVLVLHRMRTRLLQTANNAFNPLDQMAGLGYRLNCFCQK